MARRTAQQLLRQETPRRGRHELVLRAERRVGRRLRSGGDRHDHVQQPVARPRAAPGDEQPSFVYGSTAVEAWLHRSFRAKMREAAAAALQLPGATATYYRSGARLPAVWHQQDDQSEKDWWKDHGQEIVDTMASPNGPDIVGPAARQDELRRLRGPRRRAGVGPARADGLLVAEPRVRDATGRPFHTPGRHAHDPRDDGHPAHRARRRHGPAARELEGYPDRTTARHPEERLHGGRRLRPAARLVSAISARSRRAPGSPRSIDSDQVARTSKRWRSPASATGAPSRVDDGPRCAGRPWRRGCRRRPGRPRPRRCDQHLGDPRGAGGSRRRCR